MTPTKPLIFELRYRRECYTIVRGAFLRADEKDKDIPERPKSFHPFTGSHEQIAKKATELNELQHKNGFQFYFYWPEPIGPDTAPSHPADCAMCASARAKRELG